MTEKVYRSEIAAAMHQMVDGIASVRLVDKKTMREFDESCLVPAPRLSPEEIRVVPLRVV